MKIDKSVESKDDKFVKKVVKIIKSNLTEDISSEFLSKEMGMSHSVLYKKLKQLTGMTLVEFVREYKLNFAAKLLKEQHYSIQEACFEAGFQDRRYFSRVFKNKFGMTPSEYAETEVE